MPKHADLKFDLNINDKATPKTANSLALNKAGLDSEVKQHTYTIYGKDKNDIISYADAYINTDDDTLKELNHSHRLFGASDEKSLEFTAELNDFSGLYYFVITDGQLVKVYGSGLINIVAE